jgi:hypothetical protein
MTSPISTAQMKAMWGAAKRAGVDESVLRDIVESETGARSISKLTTEQAAAVLNRLIPNARRSGGSVRRFEELKRRPGMATPKQLRKIEAMVAERFRAGDKAAALREWLKTRFNVADLRFLSRTRASDVIVALEKMEVVRAA